jgi:hypothetical protein
MMKWSLKISGIHYSELRKHLYPGDNKEAIAIAICGKYSGIEDYKFLVHDIVPIPYDECSIRTKDRVTWSTRILSSILENNYKKDFSLVKIHSHPGGQRKFSSFDNDSDKELFTSVFGWMEHDSPHGSVIMLPDGEMFGRIITTNLDFVMMNKIDVIGNDIISYNWELVNSTIQDYEIRNAQTFGIKTTNALNKLSVAIIGCSGTGSPVIEQLARLGVGRLVLIDPDVIEEKNLNRILNSTIEDARKKRKKVDVIKEAIDKIGIITIVETGDCNLYDSIDLIKTVAGCDIIFGCVDSVDGRHLLNHISTFYLIPYFDLGVKIISDGKGGISQICGTVHYIKPGEGSLMTRGVYNTEELRAAGMSRINPTEYNKLKGEGYIVDVKVESPAVISINMQIASMAVNELLARIHPYRYDSNSEFDISRISISDGYYMKEEDPTIDYYLNKFVGRGDISPLLNLSEIS